MERTFLSTALDFIPLESVRVREALKYAALGVDEELGADFLVRLVTVPLFLALSALFSMVNAPLYFLFGIYFLDLKNCFHALYSLIYLVFVAVLLVPFIFYAETERYSLVMEYYAAFERFTAFERKEAEPHLSALALLEPRCYEQEDFLEKMQKTSEGQMIAFETAKSNSKKDISRTQMFINNEKIEDIDLLVQKLRNICGNPLAVLNLFGQGTWAEGATLFLLSDESFFSLNLAGTALNIKAISQKYCLDTNKNCFRAIRENHIYSGNKAVYASYRQTLSVDLRTGGATVISVPTSYAPSDCLYAAN